MEFKRVFAPEKNKIGRGKLFCKHSMMHFQMNVEAFRGSLSLLSKYLRAILNKDRCSHVFICMEAVTEPNLMSA